MSASTVARLSRPPPSEKKKSSRGPPRLGPEAHQVELAAGDPFELRVAFAQQQLVAEVAETVAGEVAPVDGGVAALLAAEQDAVVELDVAADGVDRRAETFDHVFDAGVGIVVFEPEVGDAEDPVGAFGVETFERQNGFAERVGEAEVEQRAGIGLRELGDHEARVGHFGEGGDGGFDRLPQLARAVAG